MSPIIAAITAAVSAIAEFFKWRSADAENKPDKDKADTLERSAKSLEEAQERNRQARIKLEEDRREAPQKRDHFGRDDW